MRKNLRRILDAFHAGTHASDVSVSTDGRTIMSYSVPIAVKDGRGKVVIASEKSLRDLQVAVKSSGIAPHRNGTASSAWTSTTASQVKGVETEFSTYEPKAGKWHPQFRQGRVIDTGNGYLIGCAEHPECMESDGMAIRCVIDGCPDARDNLRC